MPGDVYASVTLVMIYSLILGGYQEHETMSNLCLERSNKALSFYSNIFDRLTPELMSKR